MTDSGPWNAQVAWIYVNFLFICCYLFVVNIVACCNC